MKIWPTLATLFFCSTAYSLDRDEVELLRRNNMLGNQVLLHSDDWGVNPLKDGVATSYKGQPNSLIEWKGLNPNKWLDFNQWKLQRAQRDSLPDWRLRIADKRHKAIVGRVIQCLNECSLYSEGDKSSAQYTSVILEGDEFNTAKDSYAWIFLRDGSIVRVSPKTSVSFLETNVTSSKIFHAIRLNHGHMYFEQRKIGQFILSDRPETDMAFYPLLEVKANRTYFAREEYKTLSDHQRLLYVLEQNPGHVGQYKKLNNLLQDQYLLSGRRDTEVFIFTSNATFLLENPVFHIFHETMGESYIKLEETIPNFKIADKRNVSGQAYFRGYKNKNSKALEVGSWMSVDVEGKELSLLDDSSSFEPVEVFVKRIPTIHMAREIFLRRVSGFLFEESIDEKTLAKEHGLRLWDVNSKELDKRKEFLFERIRRVETTNLRSLKTVFKEPNIEGFNSSYYNRAVARSLMALKKLNNYNSEVLKETNDAEYYLWILKNAKEFMPTYIR
ncbi:MAG: FecR domain-containing protein [Bacteriovoracaceae bacterium]|nr:FecR domain-containing protein [Bacteriovoracaceae bacterium]